MKNKNPHKGSSLENFLEEEGVLEEIDKIVEKEIFVFLLEKQMRRHNISITQLAKKMNTSYSSAKRILDPHYPSTLQSLRRAAMAVGKTLSISLR